MISSNERRQLSLYAFEFSTENVIFLKLFLIADSLFISNVRFENVFANMDC